MKKVEFLYDALRSPYDITLIMQIALGIDAVIYTSGNCIDMDNKKIISKLQSWNIERKPVIHHFDSFEEAINKLHEQGKILVGTSGAATEDFYCRDYSDGNTVIVFGTESSGLTKAKQAMLDGIVKLPMSSKLDFYTLPIVTSAIGFEMLRQIRGSVYDEKGS